MKHTYSAIATRDGSGFQEIDHTGTVVRLTDDKGVTIMPTEYQIVDAAPPQPEWATEQVIAATTPELQVFPPLTRRQLLLGLLPLGVTEFHINAVISKIENPGQREATRIEFENNNSMHRDHPLVASLASIFGLPTNMVDATWLKAATL
jgi:hypothetical protein